ncbi:MAG: hypothetical protein HYU69_13050 [Bacteroidetes bacterium]|nr:hypothetical protein [Bacteroidota bacterium]
MRINHLLCAAISAIFTLNMGIAQEKRTLQYFRPTGLQGINRFETSKDTAQTLFDGIKVRIGGDFAIQFQALDHSTKSKDTLATLGNNFNLPTANLNLDVQLADGMRMSLVTYLSSRHHNEAWVKGGYLQVDKLDFIKKDFLKRLMNVMTVKVGMDEINYGDAHFRRSDNAKAIYNPFVGNYIMDAFNTEVFGELIFQKYNMLLVAAVSNGNLNQTVVKGAKSPKPSYYGKLGYDKTFNKDFRLRLMGSFYLSPGYDNGQYLYSGDRTGSRYYNVMQIYNEDDNFRSGRFSPGFWKYLSWQINPFIKYKGLEFFGIYEMITGDVSRTVTGGSYTQTGAELIYRFGSMEQFYGGARYNLVTGKDAVPSTNGNNNPAETKSIDRINAGAGWFLTNEVMIKAEYVNQNYSGDGWTGSVYEGGNFKGFMVEAIVGF